jgi:hypothetical protein
MFIFKFKEFNVSVDADTKLEAIINLEKNYPHLFKNQDFELLEVTLMIDKNGEKI